MMYINDVYSTIFITLYNTLHFQIVPEAALCRDGQAGAPVSRARPGGSTGSGFTTKRVGKVMKFMCKRCAKDVQSESGVYIYIYNIQMY